MRKTGINAGIVLGYESLVIVTAKCAFGKSYEILNHGNIVYGDGVNRNSPEFPLVLKNILDEYCKGFKKVDIWCTIQSKGVEARYITIPHVKGVQVEKTAYWSYKKEVEFVDEETVFDYDVIGYSTSKGKKVIEVLACTAPKDELRRIKHLFDEIGRPLAGITVTSFAFQNLFRTGWAGKKSENISTLFIGSDWSRIDIFSKGNLILSRDIKTGTSSMLEAVKESVDEVSRPEILMDDYLTDARDEGDYVLDLSEGIDKKESVLKDNGLFSIISQGETIEQELLKNKFIEIANNENHDEAEPLFTTILPVVDRLLRQVERTFDHFSSTHNGSRVDRIYLTGPLCCYNKLREYSSSQLGVPIDIIDPLHPEGTTEIKGQVRHDMAQRDAFVPATGLALSNLEHTLNFNHTYRHKANAKINTLITKLSFFLILIATFAGVVFYVQIKETCGRQFKEINRLTGEIKARETMFDRNNILVYADSVEREKEKVSRYAKRFYGSAVLGEIFENSSGKIALTSIVYEKNGGSPGSVFLEGLVLEEQAESQTILDGYIEKLSGSKLVKGITIDKKNEFLLDGKNLLYFKSHLELKQ